MEEDERPILGPQENSECDDRTNEVEGHRSHVRRSCYHRYVTVEPLLVLYFIYIFCTSLLSEQYIFARVAISYNYSEKTADGSICHLNRSGTDLLKIKQIQQQSSICSLVVTCTSLFPAIFTTLLLGSYSDTRGRKLAILVPLVGALFRSAGYLVVVGFRLSPWYLVIGSVIEGTCGGSTAFLMSCFAYLGDVTTHKSRSFRVVVAECAISISSVSSMMALGYVIESVGYLYPFIFLVGVTLLNIAYVYFVLPETVQRSRDNQTFFQLQHIKRVVSLFIKDNGTNRRWKLQLSALIFCVAGLPFMGQSDSIAYFLKGAPLCFTAEQLGFFEAGVRGSYVVGSLLGVHFLGPHVGDDGLMILGSLSAVATSVVLAFAQHIWMLVLVVILGVLAGLVLAVIRSFQSKLVKTDEQGAIFASIACIESLCVTAGVAMFNSIYSASIYILAGFVFLVIGGTFFISLILSSVLFILNKRQERTREN